MGPLSGIKIIEIAGIGPGPFCAMMLADLGAEVVRVDRKSNEGNGSNYDVLNRGRKSIAIDLKNPAGIETVLALVEGADALLEGFRPGVMERLGIGPDVCMARNPKLIFGRMTGWGQDGPMAQAAGHDINYIALTGALHSIGRKDAPPTPPLNLVGDFGGGGMLLALGITSALLETQKSGKGQIVDAAMTDGSAALMGIIYGQHGRGAWKTDRQVNMLDGGAHFYDTYECSDGKFISIGSIEPQFYALLLEKAELTDELYTDQHNRDNWPELKTKTAEAFRTKTRAEWCAIMEYTDVCFAPVLDLEEAPQHEHNKARNTFVEIEGVTQHAPAPRFSRTPSSTPTRPPRAGEHTDDILERWGFSDSKIAALKETGAV
jgi:alpha-methylacyl-CoA racemase